MVAIIIIIIIIVIEYIKRFDKMGAKKILPVDEWMVKRMSIWISVFVICEWMNKESSLNQKTNHQSSKIESGERKNIHFSVLTHHHHQQQQQIHSHDWSNICQYGLFVFVWIVGIGSMNINHFKSNFDRNSKIKYYQSISHIIFYLFRFDDNHQQQHYRLPIESSFIYEKRFFPSWLKHHH